MTSIYLPDSLSKKEKQRIYSDRWREKNRELSRAASKRWRLKNLERVKISSKNNFLRKLYGLTLQQFNHMLIQQGYLCAICSAALGKGPRDTHVDHCHATGKVRSILCNNCNNMLGRARDDSGILRKGAEYLDRWRCS
jgi:hypothetical protein